MSQIACCQSTRINVWLEGTREILLKGSHSSEVQYKTVEYITVQYKAPQYSAAQNSEEMRQNRLINLK